MTDGGGGGHESVGFLASFWQVVLALLGTAATYVIGSVTVHSVKLAVHLQRVDDHARRIEVIEKRLTEISDMHENSAQRLEASIDKLDAIAAAVGAGVRK